MLFKFSALTAVALLVELAFAQCPNAVAAFNPNLRTMSTNNTWLLVPVPAAAAKQAVDESYPLGAGGQPLSLLPLPAALKFPAGTHPVLVSIGLQADVRMSILQIDGNYMGSSVSVPYIGKGASEAPLQAAVSNYIAGTSDNTAGQLGTAGIIPSLVSTVVGGITLRLGSFIPTAAAYQSNGKGLFSAQSKWVVVPNPISGPGVYIEAADVSFVTDPNPKYPLTLLKSIINQPLLLTGALSGMCIRNTYFFGNATAQPIMRAGNVTFGPGADGAGLLSGSLQTAVPGNGGIFTDLHGVSACAQAVGYNNQDCDQASSQVDPNA